MMRITRTLIALTALVFTCTSAPAGDLEAGFRNPPETSRPGCYWYWINDNVSKEGITKDLEAMARVGIGRAYIGHIYNRRSPGDTSESIFVVFRESIDADVQGTAASNTPQEAIVATLDGPWTVRFDGQGAPEKVVFETLVDWAKHPDDAIKYYAGTGVYEFRFTLTKPADGRRTVLELGELGVIATVLVNGQEAGTVWTTPWEIDITPFVKPGRNDLSIRVANTWNNRLVADAALPEDQRQSHVSQPYRFKGNDPLHKGGLLGPVVLKQQN